MAGCDRIEAAVGEDEVDVAGVNKIIGGDEFKTFVQFNGADTDTSIGTDEASSDAALSDVTNGGIGVVVARLELGKEEFEDVVGDNDKLEEEIERGLLERFIVVLACFGLASSTTRVSSHFSFLALIKSSLTFASFRAWASSYPIFFILSSAIFLRF